MNWLDSWPQPLRSRAEAVRSFGGGLVGEGWADGLAERDGGWWPRFDRDVIENILRSDPDRDQWAEWSLVRCLTLAVIGQTGVMSTERAHQVLARRPQTLVASIPGARPRSAPGTPGDAGRPRPRLPRRDRPRPAGDRSGRPAEDPPHRHGLLARKGGRTTSGRSPELCSEAAEPGSGQRQPAPGWLVVVARPHHAAVPLRRRTELLSQQVMFSPCRCVAIGQVQLTPTGQPPDPADPFAGDEPLLAAGDLRHVAQRRRRIPVAPGPGGRVDECRLGCRRPQPPRNPMVVTGQLRQIGEPARRCGAGSRSTTRRNSSSTLLRWPEAMTASAMSSGHRDRAPSRQQCGDALLAEPIHLLPV
jgi:hypothetical protein